MFLLLALFFVMRITVMKQILPEVVALSFVLMVAWSRKKRKFALLEIKRSLKTLRGICVGKIKHAKY